MRKLNSKGFGTVEILLTLTLVALIVGVGWYVWQNKQKTNKLNTISSFADCKSSGDSKLQETFPEVCVTRNGKSFVNPSQNVPDRTVKSSESTDSTRYLVIKEWGVEIPLSSVISDAYYATTNQDTPAPSQIGLSLSSLKNTQCKAEDWSPATYFRYTDMDQDPVSGKLYTELDGKDHKIGNYYYSYVDGYGIIKNGGCKSTATNQTAANNAAMAFKTALERIKSIN